MKKRKIKIRIGLAIVWLACLLFGVAYWNLEVIGVWPITLALVGIGIFASVFFLRDGMRKGMQMRIWLWCVAFCFFMFCTTILGVLVSNSHETTIALNKIAQTQLRAENAMAEYMKGHGTYIKGTKRTIRIETDVVYRSGIWKMEEGEEEWQIVLLLVKITGEDIGHVREILLPISEKELSGSFKEKAGKPTQGSTSQRDGGPPIYFP